MRKLSFILIFIYIFNALNAKESYSDLITKGAFGIGFGGWEYNGGLNVETTIYGLTYEGLFSFCNLPAGESEYGEGDPLKHPNINNHLIGYEFPIKKIGDGIIKISPLLGVRVRTWYYEDFEYGSSKIYKRISDFNYGFRGSFYFNNNLFISLKGFKYGASFCFGASFY